MSVFVNIEGVWEEVTTPSININGVHTDLTQVSVNINGVWMSVWNASIWNKDTYFISKDVTAKQINKAVEQMTSGGTLLFGRGEWILTSPILITKSNIEIIGVPNLTKLSRGADFHSAILRILGTAEIPLENIKIKGLILDCNFSKSRFAGSGIFVSYTGKTPTSGLTSGGYDASSVGIGVENKIGVVIENCTIQDIGQTFGIEMRESHNSIVTGNTVQNNANTGIYLSHSHSNLFTKNTIQNNNSHGISSISSNNNIITGNTIQNSSDGIELFSSSSHSITGNTIQNNGGSAISLNFVTNTIMAGNTVQNNGGNGIYFMHGSLNNNNIITGNTIQYNNNYGIYLGNVHANNNVAMSNIVVKNVYQITDYATGSLIYGNIIVQ